jgi:hypothetical protein
MTRFFFRRRFNRFDTLVLLGGVAFASREHWIAAVIVVLVGAIVSVSGEILLADPQP